MSQQTVIPIVSNPQQGDSASQQTVIPIISCIHMSQQTVTSYFIISNPEIQKIQKKDKKPTKRCHA